MKNKLIITSLVAASSLLFAGSASADSRCQPIYGGGENCPTKTNIVLDKKVMNPQSKVFVDNLGVNDPKYAAEQTVTFELTVKNTGNAKISKVDVKDILPQYVTYVSGPGTYDSGSKTVYFSVHDLEVNESRNFTITAKVAKTSDLPKNQGVTCVVNQAIATTSNKSAQDNAQFCVEKKVLGEKVPTETKGGKKVFPTPEVKTTPATGPEMLVLAGLIPSGLVGFILRRKSSLS